MFKIKLSSHLIKTLCLAVLLLVNGGTSVFAQNIFDLMIQKAMEAEALEKQRKAVEAQRAQERAAERDRVNAIRQTWSGIDENVSACVNRHLQASGQSIEILINKGLPSSDPQLSGLFSKCNIVSSQKLMKGVPCAVEGSQSVCNEVFVFTNSPSVALNADQLATAVMANRINEIGTTQLEPADVKSKRVQAQEQRRREQMIDSALAKLSPLTDPSNAFASKRAIVLQKSVTGARGNAKVTIEQVVQLAADTDRLVSEDREEKLRIERLRTEKVARGEVDIKGAGTGATQKAAKTNAYWDIFLIQLRELVSSQADGDLGKSFRQTAEKDIDKFRADYFTSDSTEKCAQAQKGFRCDVVGTFKTLALKTEVQKVMSTTLAENARNYRFILRYADPEDHKTECGEQKAETTRFLVNQVSSEFNRRGYSIIAKSAEDSAEEKGGFDYYLNILDINYCDQQDFNGARINFTLRAQIKLLDKGKDPSARLELANVPVSNSRSVIRDMKTPLDASKRALLPMQGTELAGLIVKEVDAKLLTLDQNKNRQAGSVAGSVRAASQYSIKIEGLSQRDRQQIRALRDLVKAKLGVETAVDAKGTTDKSVEITFEREGKFDPEDIVDSLYELFKDKKAFKAKYNGNHSFTGQL
jgi:hypothetical protein